VTYAKTLHSLVRWIGICDGNMQEGSFRCDVNVSVRRPGEPLGTRREIKNLNSFKFMQQAIDYEVQWQIDTLENGGKIHQATVLFDPDKGSTHAMRSKEEAHDYRYFPDPDLLPLDITLQWIAEVKEDMFHEVGQLPHEWIEELTSYYGLSSIDARSLTNEPRTPLVFVSATREALLNGETESQSQAAKLAANWIINEFLPQQLAAKEDFPNVAIVEGVAGDTVGYLIRLMRDGKINAKAAKEIHRELWGRARKVQFTRHGGTYADVDQLIEERGLTQVSDSGAIEQIVDEIIAANPAQLAEYRSGKEKVFGFFVGLAMKASKGKANPAQLNEVLKKKLAG
jgi:aspartyl-tRNA(Asn)/glutamyl-tRNA(Gln) amidotransferase subunit B